MLEYAGVWLMLSEILCRLPRIQTTEKQQIWYTPPFWGLFTCATVAQAVSNVYSRWPSQPLLSGVPAEGAEGLQTSWGELKCLQIMKCAFLPKK